VVVRAVEILYACDEGLRLIQEYEPPQQASLTLVPHASTGAACTEAPRGLFYHRYEIAPDGAILDATIVPPTSQNQKAIEADVRAFAQEHMHLKKRPRRAVRAGGTQSRSLHLVRDPLDHPGSGRDVSERTQAGRKLVVGLGNEWRGDDGVGLLVARRLRAKALDGVIVRDVGNDPTQLLEAWANADVAYVIDALCSGSEPGTARRWDVSRDSLDGNIFRLSTHRVTVAEAVELARALKQLPRRLVVFGIEGQCYCVGCEVSLEVRRGADRIADTIERELRDAETETKPSTR
jgi:hydrogenase maturation protease